jgi:hypothetical protein
LVFTVRFEQSQLVCIIDMKNYGRMRIFGIKIAIISMGGELYEEQFG